GMITLSEQVADFDQCLDADRSVAGLMEFLADVQIEVRGKGVEGEWSHFGKGIVGLPAVAGAPACARTIEGARKRDREFLNAARRGRGGKIGQILPLRKSRSYERTAVCVAGAKKRAARN